MCVWSLEWKKCCKTERFFLWIYWVLTLLLKSFAKDTKRVWERGITNGIAEHKHKNSRQDFSSKINGNLFCHSFAQKFFLFFFANLYHVGSMCVLDTLTIFHPSWDVFMAASYETHTHTQHTIERKIRRRRWWWWRKKNVAKNCIQMDTN